MNTQISLVVSFPPDTASRLALHTGQGRCEAFRFVGDALIDAGAVSVTWGEPEENVHAPKTVHCEHFQELKPVHGAPMPTCQQASAASEKSKAQRAVIDCLSTAGRALEKKVLMELMAQQGVGVNAARKAIAGLEQCSSVRQFAVPREGKKSAVYVALI